jgi:hypothetical protein
MSSPPRRVPIALPDGAARREREAFARLCKTLAGPTREDLESINRTDWFERANLGELYDRPILAAAAHTLIDLVDQGWSISFVRRRPVLTPPPAEPDPVQEKTRVRRQEHLRRDQQLSTPSVRRFVVRMEQPRDHDGELVSVFNLMRDGRELTEALQTAPQTAIKPYIQVVDGQRCEFTGLLLSDIWRYFRHTWSNAYFTVPGRSMAILVRDAATPHHAIIGLAAVSSPVVRIAGRDKWIGWDTDAFMAWAEAEPSVKIARWIRERLVTQIDDVYRADFLEDGVIQPSDLSNPNAAAVSRLRVDGERHRQKHHRASNASGSRRMEHAPWIDRARTALFRGKRAAALADALEGRAILEPLLSPSPTREALISALENPAARQQIRRLVHRARGERVGTVIADLTVCGALQPYSALAAGKLVGALAVSPKVVAAYRDRYTRPSEIASAMAGRPVTRESRLSFISTTSLYGSGSSQYNRLRWPADLMGGRADAEVRFRELGRSRSFGTSQFTDETLEALVRLSRVQGDLVRVNGIFGEGVSPRMRKIRIGLAALGWPTNDLLMHGRERILYGVQLVENLRDYSLGIDPDPNYLIEVEGAMDEQPLAGWWLERWALRRAEQDAVIATMRSNTLVLPVQHGARVVLPDAVD